MYRDASAVRNHDAFDVFRIAYHTFRTDIVSTVHLLDITSAGILVVAAQGGIDVADGNVQRIEGIRVDRHLVLFQVAAETVNLHNPRNTRKLPLHNPVLNRA